ncbi:MAG: (2Fe-2S)-binding protein [Bdellovibrionaceae bacterium]|nr:(2Fe-2S)-binding protein [Pseudobdellovibrionaceae bacterium]
MNKQNKVKSEIICRCNSVTKAQIELALKGGAKTLNEIFDHCNAGVGACGGSCRGKLKHLLDSYLATGQVPEKVEDLWLIQKKPK